MADVITTQPGAGVTVVTQGAPSGEWEHSLFGCFDDCGACLLGYCCPCIAFGMNASDSGTCCPGCCGTFWGCILFVFCTEIVPCVWCCCIRPNIRRKHNIEGNCCGDCMSIWCCPCCALIQERQQCNTPVRNQQVIIATQPGQAAYVVA